MRYTYRELFTKHLPEPYRSQAIANTLFQGLPVDEPLCPYDDLRNVLLEAFTWRASPEGFDYWVPVSLGKFEIPALHLEAGKRYLTRDGRVAEVANEDRIYSPESCYRFDGAVEGEPGFCWSAAGRYENQRENPLDLVSEIVEAVEEPVVDPGEGYRLLEEDETILEGDEEADDEGGGGWSAVSPRAAGDTFDRYNWFPVRRKIAAPTYRLLNPGEIIREGDEVWIACLGAWDTYWPGVIGDLKADYPAPPARRQIKSYEDA